MRHLLAGDWRTARSFIERVIGVFRRGNVVFMLPYAVACSAWALAQLGDTGEVLDRLEEARQLLERLASTGIVSLNCWANEALGRACLVVGHLDEARRFGERTIDGLPSHRGFAAHAQHLLGEISTHPSRFDATRGEGHYRQALALAEARGMRPLIAFCHLGLARLYGRANERPRSIEHMNVATGELRALDVPWWLERAEAPATS
jgi:tetratricopeptide (TPR) repeat protein